MRATSLTPVLLTLVLSTAATGCTGQIEGPGAGDRRNAGPGGSPGGGAGGAEQPSTPETHDGSRVPRAPDSNEQRLGDPMVRRLTSRQLEKSLRDIFQDSTVPTGDVLVDTTVFGFQVDAKALVIRDLGAQQLMTYADRVASWAVERKLNQVSPCQSNDSGCRRRFIESFGKKMFREPLKSGQIDTYETLMASEPSFNDGVQIVIATMIQSPNFLYRREIGRPSTNRDEVELTPFEVASSLAYLVTDSPPDEALLRAAEQGQLSTPDGVTRELDRLLATNAAKEVLGRFVSGWLQISDLPARVKSAENQTVFNDALRRSMLTETETLFSELLLGGGSIDELLSSRYTYLDQNLSRFYGIPGANGDTFTKVNLPAGKRPRGILGHGSFLARHALAEQSSPVLRGYAIRKRLMCERIAPPPAGIDTNIRPPAGASTTREKYREHSTNSTCSGCHRLMDPIGFTFENYDELGRRREQQNNIPIDETGFVLENDQMSESERVRVPNGNLALVGNNELIDFLVNTDAVESCFARYLTYFAYGVDGVGVHAVTETARALGGSMKNHLMAIVKAPNFMHRRAVMK